MSLWRGVILISWTIFLVTTSARQEAVIQAPEGSDSGGGGGGAVPRGVGGSREHDAPLVMVGILARNAAHALPNFLGYLENLDYPKRRMAVW